MRDHDHLTRNAIRRWTYGFIDMICVFTPQRVQSNIPSDFILASPALLLYYPTESVSSRRIPTNNYKSDSLCQLAGTTLAASLDFMLGSKGHVHRDIPLFRCMWVQYRRLAAYAMENLDLANGWSPSGLLMDGCRDNHLTRPGNLFSRKWVRFWNLSEVVGYDLHPIGTQWWTWTYSNERVW